MVKNNDTESKGFERESSKFSERRENIRFIPPRGVWRNTESRREEFLKNAMSDFFGYKPYPGYYLPKVVDGRFEIWEYIIPRGNTQGCVYYNHHYYLEIDDPSLLKHSGDPNHLYLTYESLINEVKTKVKQIDTPSRIKWVENPDDPGHKKPIHITISEEIIELEKEWRDRGYILRPLEDDNQDTCRYCGKKLNPLRLLSDMKPGRYPEFCDDECHQRRIRFDKRIKNYAAKYYLDEKKRETFLERVGILLKQGYTPKELETKYMTSRCRYCGKIISNEKRTESEFCDISCRNGFNNRLKKERKTNPNITPKQLVEILNNERKLEIKKRVDEKVKSGLIDILESVLRSGGVLSDKDKKAYFERFGREEFEGIISDIMTKLEKENIVKSKLPSPESERKREDILTYLYDYLYCGEHDDEWEGYFKRELGVEYETLIGGMTKLVEIEHLNTLETYISVGGRSIDPESMDNDIKFLRDWFGDNKFGEYVTKIKEKLEDNKSYVIDEFGHEILNIVLNQHMSPLVKINKMRSIDKKKSKVKK